MRFIAPPALRAALLALSCAACASASAQTVAIGKALYNSTCNAAGCHNAAGSDANARKATNSTSLRNSLSSVSQMRYLTSVLSTQDIADIAAYIASPNSVPASASSDNERILNWAEWKLQNLLQPRASTQSISGFAVRYYKNPDLYVGFSNGTTYTYQGGQLNNIGSTASWLQQAAADGF